MPRSLSPLKKKKKNPLSKVWTDRRIGEVDTKCYGRSFNYCIEEISGNRFNIFIKLYDFFFKFLQQDSRSGFLIRIGNSMFLKSKAGF